MELTEVQRLKVATWLNCGLKLAEVQERLEAEFGLRLTYMEVKLLVSDLRVVPKDERVDAPPEWSRRPTASDAPSDNARGGGAEYAGPPLPDEEDTLGPGEVFDPSLPEGETVRIRKRKRRRQARSLMEELGSQSLLKLLIRSPWLRLVFLGFLGCFVAVALVLPKIWRTTPKDFLPVIRISLLDRGQVWSLRRAARAAEEEGNFGAAFSAWRAAWFNNVADLKSIRGFLGVIPRYDRAEGAVSLCMQAGEWLRRLGGTNVTDIEVTARAYVKAGLSGEAARLLDALGEEMPERLERIYLMALYEVGRTGEFVRRMGASPVVQEDLKRSLNDWRFVDSSQGEEADFRLHCLAYLAGWGPADQQAAALEGLQKAEEDRRTEATAYNLEFILSHRFGRVERCAQILEALDALGKATVRQHTDYWMLLLGMGRAEEAKELVSRASLAPANVMETYRLALALTSLELWDRADQLVEQFSASVGVTARLLVLHSEILIKRQSWDALRNLALRIRSQARTSQTLGAFSYYLEGIAELQSNDPGSARKSFQKAAEIGFTDLSLVMSVAKGLLELGGDADEVAYDILEASHDRLAEQTSYLELRLRCEDALKRFGRLTEIARKLYEREPRSIKTLNNYAAALTTSRQEPELAVKLSLLASQRLPNGAIILLNHAKALIQNGRYRDALGQLRRVIVRRLDPSVAAQYYLALFEAQWKLGNRLEAEYALGRLQPEYLWDVQRAWLEPARSAFASEEPAPSAGG